LKEGGGDAAIVDHCRASAETFDGCVQNGSETRTEAIHFRFPLRASA
jgi:hypothetical protein